MSVSDKLNQIAKIRRSQDTKERIAFGHALGSCAPDLTKAERDRLIKLQIKANKLQFCGSWIYLREFLNTGEAKIMNALLCKLPFLCEVCAVRRQAKYFAATIPKVDQVTTERPELIPVMITRTIKSGPDLQRQADHFRNSREKMRKQVNRGNTKSCRNRATLEMAKVVGQVRSFEVKRPTGNEDHWHFHEHIFALITDYIDVQKLQNEWLEVTGDSFIVDVRKIHAKEGVEDSDPIGSALAEVLKYPLKFAGLAPCDAWHAHQILGGSRMTEYLGALRGVTTGELETDNPLEDESGPYRDFIANWIEERQAFALSTPRVFAETLTNVTANRPLRTSRP